MLSGPWANDYHVPNFRCKVYRQADCRSWSGTRAQDRFFSGLCISRQGIGLSGPVKNADIDFACARFSRQETSVFTGGWVNLGCDLSPAALVKIADALGAPGRRCRAGYLLSARPARPASYFACSRGINQAVSAIRKLAACRPICGRRRDKGAAGFCTLLHTNLDNFARFVC
jgi:hypothetical protein